MEPEKFPSSPPVVMRSVSPSRIRQHSPRQHKKNIDDIATAKHPSPTLNDNDINNNLDKDKLHEDKRRRPLSSEFPQFAETEILEEDEEEEQEEQKYLSSWNVKNNDNNLNNNCTSQTRVITPSVKILINDMPYHDYT